MLAFEMSLFARELAKEGIRREHPEWQEAQVGFPEPLPSWIPSHRSPPKNQSGCCVERWNPVRPSSQPENGRHIAAQGVSAGSEKDDRVRGRQNGFHVLPSVFCHPVFPPFRAHNVLLSTQGLRPGLDSDAASRLCDGIVGATL